MSVNMTHNIKNKKAYVISLTEGDNIEIRLNDNPVINATVSVGTQGSVRLEYVERVL